MIGSAVNDLAALLEIPINFPRNALVNKEVDELFAAIRINVSGSGLDPLPLPTDSDDFNVTVNLVHCYLSISYYLYSSVSIDL